MRNGSHLCYFLHLLPGEGQWVPDAGQEGGQIVHLLLPADALLFCPLLLLVGEGQGAGSQHFTSTSHARPAWDGDAQL